MLRAIVLLLLLANLAWWSAHQGWLPAGWLPWASTSSQREPQRLAAQQRPETIQILPAEAGRPGAQAEGRPVAESAAAADGEPGCLEAGPFTSVQWPGAEAAVEPLGMAATSWRRVAAGSAATGVEGDWLRVPAADGPLRARLLALDDSRLGGGFHDCR